ncbi:Flp family type IVb pilin [Actinobacillus equuli]|uniref:Minor fimbrial protein n=1 Tax=Actinobacillus equuli TaxID=718 RepID=A0AAX3FHT9_ACTEU|nr:Flp family type IVb pilin [Actinobacillus equuli]AIZ79017.1 fimbrial protein [Actinobacillus equuli subsp. equuli]WGE45264.1 Flp family type IVb pilin [Actinobacillus equuli subsp. equuli]VEE89100.1 minor fimbrial protein [Actinobacillus equuli]
MKRLLQFYLQQQGVTAIEYGLIAVTMAVTVVAILYGEASFIDETLKKFNQLTELVKTALLSTA